MLTEFGQFIVVLATGVGTTIGVCVYLIKSQQKERESLEKQRVEERRLAEERSDKRTDEFVHMLRDQMSQQVEVLKDLHKSNVSLQLAVKELTDRLKDVEVKVNGNGSRRRKTTSKVSE